MGRAYSKPRGRLARALAAASIALVSAGCATAQDAGGAPTTSAASLPREDFDYRGWDAYVGGAESSQYSALTQITKDNVNQLGVAWTYEAGPGQPPQFNPIVADGKMFVLRGDGKIAALHPATGQELWQSATTGRIGVRGINYWQSADGSDRRLVFLNDG